MMLDNEPPNYIYRIQRSGLEKQMYSRRMLYVNIKRNWLPHTRLLFVRTAEFIGSGIVDSFFSLGDLGEDEKKWCLENNCYGKIEFSKLALFFPAIPVQDTAMIGQNPLVLHGASLLKSDALQIERQVRARIITL
jgi:hypothetical protein